MWAQKNQNPKRPWERRTNLEVYTSWFKLDHKALVIKQYSAGCRCCCCWVASVVSDSVRPHRRQPTRLPRPWDSPGKNTGVGCHFLLQCMKVKSESEVAQSCPTLSDPMDCSPPGPSVPGIPRAGALAWVPSPSPIMLTNRHIYLLEQNSPETNAGIYGQPAWSRKIPWRRESQPTPVFLPGEFHGQWSLAGYSPWGRRELDMT